MMLIESAGQAGIVTVALVLALVVKDLIAKHWGSSSSQPSESCVMDRIQNEVLKTTLDAVTRLAMVVERMETRQKDTFDAITRLTMVIERVETRQKEQ